ncbi:MAG: U32 family peptidase [Ignavibacteriota bacterium]
MRAGADSVYFGLKHFTARAKVGFDIGELPEVFSTLHRRGVKGFVTFNTLVFEHEFDEAARVLTAIAASGADAVIVQDVGILKLVREIAPSLEIHASTQMSVTSVDGVRPRAEPGREPRNIGARTLARPGPRHSERPPIASSKSSSTAHSAWPIPDSAFRQRRGAGGARIADNARRLAASHTN